MVEYEWEYTYESYTVTSFMKGEVMEYEIVLL